jgi:hypothetical protein
VTLHKRLQAVAALMAQADAEANRPDTPEQLEDAVARLTAFMDSPWFNDTTDVIPPPTTGWERLAHTSSDDCPRCREANKVYWQTATRSLITATITIERDLRDAAPITWRRWWTEACVELPCREPSFDTLTVGE